MIRENSLCKDTNSFFHSIEENHAIVLKHNFSFLKWKIDSKEFLFLLKILNMIL